MILILYSFSYVSHYTLIAILVNAIKLIERTKRTRALLYIIKGHLTNPGKGTYQDVALAVSNQTKTLINIPLKQKWIQTVKEVFCNGYRNGPSLADNLICIM